MVDRVALLFAIASADLPAAAEKTVSGLLDKAIALKLAGLPLKAAQELTPAQKSELAIVLHHNITRSDAVKVAKVWEPKRKIDAATSHTNIANSLAELLNNERKPYTPLNELPLTDALELTSAQKSELAIELRDKITRAEAVKVAKVWEPKRKIDAATSHTSIANSLVELLNNERKPYTPITLSLAEARALPEAERTALAHLIMTVAPAADIKKLLKAWDGKNAALRTAPAAEQAKYLVKLLEDKAASDPARRKNAA